MLIATDSSSASQLGLEGKLRSRMEVDRNFLPLIIRQVNPCDKDKVWPYVVVFDENSFFKRE